LHAGDRCRLIAVADQSGALLQYASEMGLELNSPILVHAVRGFDLTMLIEVGGRMHSVSKTFADHLFVTTAS
jgi:DtxR family Mn-dependent transcriptional regulator